VKILPLVGIQVFLGMRYIPILFCLMYSTTLTAQIWQVEKGDIKTNLSFSQLSYDQVFGPDGEIYETIGFPIHNQTIQLSAEYGLTDKFSLLAKVPFVWAGFNLSGLTWDDFSGPTLPAFLEGVPIPSGGDVSAFGNIQLGATYTPGNEHLHFSILTELNTSYYNYVEGLATGMNSMGIMPGISYTIGKSKWWASAYGFGEFRTNGYSHAANLQGEFGYHIKSWWYVAMNPAVRLPFGNREDCDCSLQWTSMYLGEQTYIALTGKTGFTYKQWGLHLAIGTAPYAKNVPAVLAPTVGLSFQL
jgi:hypothetical protein